MAIRFFVDFKGPLTELQGIQNIISSGVLQPGI